MRDHDLIFEVLIFSIILIVCIMVNLIYHGIDLISFLDCPLEFVVEVFGHEAEKGEHQDGKHQKDSDSTPYVH
jgi:hypothetical protein